MAEDPTSDDHPADEPAPAEAHGDDATAHQAGHGTAIAERFGIDRFVVHEPEPGVGCLGGTQDGNFGNREHRPARCTGNGRPGCEGLIEHGGQSLARGLEVAELIATMSPRPLVVFATAFDERALEAFEVEAADYLLKPFEGKRFLAAIGRL